jgi:hypothetical protein
LDVRTVLEEAIGSEFVLMESRIAAVGRRVA